MGKWNKFVESRLCLYSSSHPSLLLPFVIRLPLAINLPHTPLHTTDPCPLSYSLGHLTNSRIYIGWTIYCRHWALPYPIAISQLQLFISSVILPILGLLQLLAEFLRKCPLIWVNQKQIQKIQRSSEYTPRISMHAVTTSVSHYPHPFNKINLFFYSSVLPSCIFVIIIFSILHSEYFGLYLFCVHIRYIYMARGVTNIG